MSLMDSLADRVVIGLRIKDNGIDLRVIVVDVSNEIA